MEEGKDKERTKKLLRRSQGQLRLNELKMEKEQRNRQSKVINKLVEDEFNKVTQQVFTSLHPQLPKVPENKQKSNLPYIIKKKLSLNAERLIVFPGAAIVIDTYEPPESAASHRRTTSLSVNRPKH